MLVIFVSGMALWSFLTRHRRWQPALDEFERIVLAAHLAPERIASGIFPLQKFYAVGYKRASDYDLILISWAEKEGKGYTGHHWGMVISVEIPVPDFSINLDERKVKFGEPLPEDIGELRDYFLTGTSDTVWFESRFTRAVLDSLLREVSVTAFIGTAEHFKVPVRKCSIISEKKEGRFILIEKKENILKTKDIDAMLSLAERIAHIVTQNNG